MYCQNCGFENKDFANFCYKCGRPLKELSPSPGQPVPQQPMPQPQQFQQQAKPQQPQQPMPQQGFVNIPYTGQNKKNKKGFLPWIIAAAIIIPGALIAAVLFLYFKTPVIDNVIASLKGTTEAKTEAVPSVDDEPEDVVSVPVITDVPSPTPAALQTADLDIWYVSYGVNDSSVTDSINRLTADFPQYTVNITWMESADYNTKLELAAASGTMPDIFTTNADMNFYNYVTNGQILDITDYMQKDNYKDRYLNAGVSQVTYKNRIYGVPGGSMTVFGIFYNKEIFNRLGLQEPTTITELEQICDTLKANGITPFELGNSINFFGNMYFSCLAERKSGINPIMSAYDGNYDSLKDGILYAGNKIQEWIGDGYFEETFNVMDDATARSNFCNGTGAMYLNGSWNIQLLQTEMPDYPGNVGFFAFPAYSEGDAGSNIALGLMGGPFYNISSSCDNPEAAFKAIQYLNDDIAKEQNIGKYLLVPYKNYVPEDAVAREVMETVYNTDAACQILDVYLPSDAANEYINNITGLFDLSVKPEEFYNYITSAMPY